jgi:FKBP-type peptidyl-prolyl cis-trans isomerase
VGRQPRQASRLIWSVSQFFSFLASIHFSSLIFMTTTPSGLEYEDTVIGEGKEAASGHKVIVHYTGWLYQEGVQGSKFD